MKAFLFLLILLSQSLWSQAPSGYNLIFEDNFTSLNSGAWWVANCSQSNPGSSSSYIKMASNVNIINSQILRLQAKFDNPSCGSVTTTHSIGEVCSSTTYLYGYFEVKAKFDANKNIWPALWLLPRTGESNEYLEIDLMEACGKLPSKGYANKFQDQIYNCNNNYNEATDDDKSYSINSGSYNTYGLEWTPTQIKIYVNGNLKHTYNNNQFHIPMKFIISAQVGHYRQCVVSTSQSDYPMNFDIEYFKVYQKQPQSFYIKGPDHICLNTTTQYLWPFYEPFASDNINNSTYGITLINDPTYAHIGSYPALDPLCGTTREGVYSSFDIQGTSPGLQKINLDLAFNSGYSRTIEKEIWVGPDQIDGYINSNSYNGPLSNGTFGISSPSCQLTVNANGASTFTWTKTGGAGSFSQNSSGTVVSIYGIGSINLTVSANTTCGISTRNIVIFNYGGSYRVAPNPTTDYIEINAEDDQVLKFTNENGDIEEVIIESKFSEVIIVDQEGQVKKHEKFRENTKSAKMNINSLKTGTYYIEIKNGEFTVRKTIVKL